MNYYQKPPKLIMSKIINNGTKKAIRERLKIILSEEEKQYKHWEENVKHRLNPTRQKEVKRKFEKRIQALKIVIYTLTPFYEQVDDEPAIVIRKN